MGVGNTMRNEITILVCDPGVDDTLAMLCLSSASMLVTTTRRLCLPRSAKGRAA